MRQSSGHTFKVLKNPGHRGALLFSGKSIRLKLNAALKHRYAPPYPTEDGGNAVQAGLFVRRRIMNWVVIP
jgi:hypothetical protein